MKCYVKRGYRHCAVFKFVENELIEAATRKRYLAHTTTKNHIDWYFMIELEAAKDISTHRINTTEETTFSKAFWEF